jgi:allantoicase
VNLIEYCQDLVVLDVRNRTAICKWIIVATGKTGGVIYGVLADTSLSGNHSRMICEKILKQAY